MSGKNEQLKADVVTFACPAVFEVPLTSIGPVQIAAPTFADLMSKIEGAIDRAYDRGCSDGKDQADDNRSASPDEAETVNPDDVRALAQAVRLGDRLGAERLLGVIFAEMGLSEAVDRGLYNSATARAAGK